MPEGPELHLASLYVNKMCDGVVFTGPVRKSQVSKNPDVPFTSEAYCITATSRGKEVKLTLSPIKSDDPKQTVKAGQADHPMDIIFRFGMSGYFRFTPDDELPKHAHLLFYSKEKPCRVLSFVDVRRFGSWHPNVSWQPNRGPCIMFEYKSFRNNVLSHLSDRAFDGPICEVLLNQKYFNGIGNYLRAEILFRLNIPPFVQARTLLEGLEMEDVLENERSTTGTKTSDKAKKKGGKPDLLRLCHTVPLEVVNLESGGKGYNPETADYSGFEAWLQCYNVDGMKSIQDHKGRTMWFKGDPGPMVPKGSKSPKAKYRPKKEEDNDCTDKKKVARNYSETAIKIKRETVAKTKKNYKEACPKELGNKTRKTEKAGEISSPQKEKKSTACRSSSAKLLEGSQRKSERVTRQNIK